MRADEFENLGRGSRGESEGAYLDVIPGRLEEVNPESRDSQVRNCAPSSMLRIAPE
jgi:hypothetical protein